MHIASYNMIESSFIKGNSRCREKVLLISLLFPVRLSIVALLVALTLDIGEQYYTLSHALS